MSKQGLVRQFGSALWREVKAAATPLQFPGYGTGQAQGFSSAFNFSQFLSGVYANSNQNWAAKVGDPSLSSLVIAAAGWVGARLPEAALTVVETDDEDNDEPIVDHPLVQLLDKPNPYYDAAGLWEHFAFSWMLDGNVYWLLRKNARGHVAEIWPLHHWMVFPRWRTQGEYISAYEYVPNSQSLFYSPDEIVHFRVGVSDPDNNRKGISPLRSVLREVFSDGELANFSANIIQNSGVPPLVVTTKEMAANLGIEEMRRFQSDLQRRLSGDQRGKVLFHSWPLEVQKLSFTPAELDLRKLRYMSEERFCSVVRINPMTLKFGAASETQTYNNVESFRRQDIEDYMCPLWKRAAGTLTNRLLSLPQFNATPNQYVLFDTSTVTALQEKENEKHDRVRADVAAGLLKVKDAQMMLGWKPDEEADYYLRQSTLVEVREGQIMIPQSQAGAMPPEDSKQKPTSEDESVDAGEMESDEAEPTKRMDASILDAARPWLLSIGEDEIAEMLDAVPVEGD